MAFLRNVLINANSAINQRRWLRHEADRLRAAADPGTAVVVRALDGVLQDKFTPQERSRMQAIEVLRRRLLTSLGKLENTDAGVRRDGFPPVGANNPMGAGAGITVARAALSSKSAFWARVLFKLISESRPRVCLELGTNMGISAAYQASALKLIGAGKLITLEGAEPRARMARRNFDLLGLDNTQIVIGRFQDTLPGALTDHGPVDFAFIDGHHDERATKGYFNQIAAHLSRSALVVLDDISWSDGMKRAWADIRRGPRIRISADLHVLGLCVMA